MTGIRRIVVAIMAEHQFEREVIAGIAQAPCRRREGWELVLAGELAQRADAWPLPWRPDGILIWSHHEAVRTLLAAQDVPYEDLAGPADGQPAVRTDVAAICRLAIDHLVERGYRQIAVAGILAHPDHRLTNGLLAEAARRGVPAATRPLEWRSAASEPFAQVADFAAWLATLPRPVGLVCHAGGQALSAAAACRRAGLRIPDDVGLLTSDDEPLATLLAAVPLSAIGKPDAQVGERLAERLALRLAGRDPGPPEVLPPTGIIARASTELLRIGDPLVAKALA